MYGAIDKGILNFIDFLWTAFSIGKHVTNFRKRKNGGHFEKLAPVGWRYMPHTATLGSCAEVNEFLLAYVILY